MAIILFDGNAHQTLLPLTYTRPVADLRIGILTIAEKWAKHLHKDHSFYTLDYLQAKFPVKIETNNLFINGAVCPDENLLEAIDKLETGQALKYNDQLLAVRLNQTDANGFNPEAEFNNIIDYTSLFVSIRYPEDIFRKNDI